MTEITKTEPDGIIWYVRRLVAFVLSVLLVVAAIGAAVLIVGATMAYFATVVLIAAIPILLFVLTVGIGPYEVVDGD